jgi:hypothetical protein
MYKNLTNLTIRNKQKIRKNLKSLEFSNSFIGSFIFIKISYTQKLSFVKARKFVRSLKLKSQKAWQNFCKSGKRPDNIPAAPWITYKKEWISWYDWLGCGNNRKFCSFVKARKFARSLKLKNFNEWFKFCKSGKRPFDIPTNPQMVYKEKWISWHDWFGVFKNF